MWPMGMVCVSLLCLSSALVCPDGGVCEDRNTCCRNTAGGYGCCPLPHAECCSDHLHCCYQGTVCDLLHQRCVNRSVSLPWTRSLPAAPRSSVPQRLQRSLPVTAVLCPDRESECPDDTTCCQLPDQSWGCCPMAKAVCCEDKRHCCPEGTRCDLEHSKCVSPSLHSSPMLENMAARKRVKHPATSLQSVVCPGGKSRCPDSHTCCQLSSGEYGCCPFPQATCCNDLLHCCPRDTVCDLKHGACTSGMLRLPLGKKIPSVPNNNAAVPCNSSVSCAEGSTCCESPQATWACCPSPQAVCCDDHLHCCPHGTTCNLATSTCDDSVGGAVLSWLGQTPAVPSQSDNSKCDESTSCPGTSTCCKTEGGAWACCPLPQAVCCDDHIHCCPHGSVCNLAAKTCDDLSGVWPSVAWAEKSPAVTSERLGEKCDAQTMCPRGTTCCQKEDGEWACCPVPQAVCCDDHQHCCPKGYKCNVSEQTCDRPGAISTPWLQKTPPTQLLPAPSLSKGNMCDAVTSCPPDTSCCFRRRAQEWGCCPLPEAVCCEDGDHCCPKGHTCELHRSSCSRGTHSVPWFTKLSARTEPAIVVGDVKCDDKSSCPSGTTCCKLPTGDWGCCPLVKAVCCDDHTHCCPQSYTCNMQTGTCEKNLDRPVPLSRVLTAERREAARGSLTPCDAMQTFHCPQGHTCCPLSHSEWSCCPFDQAVCCSDSLCCPAGYSCDLRTGGCTQTVLRWDNLWKNRRTHARL